MSKTLRGFLRQSSHYSAGQVLILFASLISFPILTRTFSVAEYGTMSLISNTVLIVTAIAKAGLQNSIVRFHDEYARGEQKERYASYLSSLLLGGLTLALLVAAIWALGTMVVDGFIDEHEMTFALLLVSSGMVFLRSAESLVLGFLRAEQQTLALNGYRVIVRYLLLGAMVLFLFLVSKSLMSFYVSQVAAMTLGLAALAWWRFRAHWPRLKNFSREIFQPALHYGFPLIGFELVSMLLNYVDRYCLQYYLGAADVGLYSAAYNLSDYVKDVVVMPLTSAVTPIYMRIWATKGQDATRKFLENALRTYTLFAIPLVLGFAADGKTLLHVIASEKFSEGQTIVPWLIAGLMVNGAVPILAASLYIQKRTNLLVAFLGVTTTLNLAGNLVLIPLYGILGAAVAKLFSYVLLVTLVAIPTYRFLHFKAPWRAMAKYALMGMLMYLAITFVKFGNPLLELASDLGLGLALYAALVLAVDGKVLENVKDSFNRAAP
jgi:O-antigen/teichoic acid export membrane protein